MVVTEKDRANAKMIVMLTTLHIIASPLGEEDMSAHMDKCMETVASLLAKVREEIIEETLHSVGETNAQLHH